jgi:hypothetical protein
MASSMPKAVSPRPAPTARAAADTIVPYSNPPLSSRDAHQDATAGRAARVPSSVTSAP